MAEMPAITLVNLTKRELFAAIALQGFISCSDVLSITTPVTTPAERARFAVVHADALIAELAKP